MEGRGRPSYYNIGDVPGEPGMIRRNSRSEAAPPYQRPRASSVPRGAALSPVSNLSALERGMHPTGSPVVGSPAASPNHLGGVLPPPPGLPEFGGVSPVQAPPQPTVESFLLHTVQQQQNQVAQLTALVQTLVSREPAVVQKGKGTGGDLSSITDSTNRMDVDEGGAPIRNPKAESYVPKLPAIDGVKMSKGPWIALFDDRIPEELHRAIASEVTIKQSSLDKGQSVRSTRTFLYLKQSLQSFPRGLDVVKQVEKEQLGSPAGYECMRRLHQELSVASRIEASTLRNEALQYRSNTPANRPLDMFRNIQLEIAKFSRLTAGFPDLALSEADRCMVVLRNLDVEVKKYVLLHARVDSMEQLETALKFYDANLKILTFQEKEDFVASYECAWSEPVVLEGSELVVALEVSEPPVELESSPCDVVVLGEVPEFFEVPTRTIEPAESQEVPNRTPVELAESRDFPGRTLVELASPLEVSFSLAESEPLSFEKGRFADFQNGVELGMVHGLSCHGHGMVAHETVASASQQHDTMDWWLVDSGASAHIINQDTLSRAHVVSNREAASECISATGDSIGVRRSAVVRVPFVLVSGETVITELQVLVAPVKFNLLSLVRLLGRSWTVDFMPNFKVEAAGYSLRTRWCSNCGWIMSRGVPLSESVAESDSVAVATRVSLKPSPAGEKPERRDG